MVENIFAVNIYAKTLNITNQLNDKMLKDCQEQEYYGNVHSYKSDASKEQKLLDLSIYSQLKKQVLSHSKKYLNEIGHQFDDLQVINSWSTKTQETGFSQFHTHKNSYISGCYYLEATSPIAFENPIIKKWYYEPIVKFDRKNTATFRSINFTPKPKTLILFPSFLNHRIIINNSKKDRHSIAFNIIPKGEFGDMTQKLYL